MVFIIFIIYFSSKPRYTSMQYLAAASKSTSSNATRKTSVAILRFALLTRCKSYS